MKRHKYAVGADEGNPEMHLTQRFVEHASSHFSKPEIGSGEDAKDGGHAHDHVEMAHHEVGGVQINIDGWLRQEKAADASTDEHGNETKGEQGGSGHTNIGPVKTTQPNQIHDRRGKGVGRGGEET